MSSSRRRSTRLVCQQLVERVTDYLEGDLDPRARLAVEEHLSVCGDCAGYVEQVRHMLALTSGSMPEPVPDAMLDVLLHRYRERR